MTEGRCSLLWGALLVGLVSAVVFLAYPALDLRVTDVFYGGGRIFLFRNPTGEVFRGFFKLLFGTAVVVFVVGFFLSFFPQKFRPLFGLSRRQWGFLVACAIVGPGLVANLLFKDNWGRARPFHITEYGSTKTFSPPLLISDQCEKNCSFVSGEASTIYMLFFSLGCLAARRRWRRRLLAAGVVMGSLAGLIRMGQGDHFFSDVIFAGVFMALTAQGLHWLFFRWRRFAEVPPP